MSKPRAGQFKKGGGRIGGRQHHKSSSPRASSSAMVLARPQAPVVVTRTRTVKVPVPVRPKRNHHSGKRLMQIEHGVGEMVPGPFRLRAAAVSGALGYADSGQGLHMVKEVMDKVPEVGQLPKEILVGLVLNYLADDGNEWADAGAQGFLDVGSYKFGLSGLKTTKDEK